MQKWTNLWISESTQICYAKVLKIAWKWEKFYISGHNRGVEICKIA